MITVSVDDTSPVPPFEQVRAQIASVITTGAVPAGDDALRAAARDYLDAAARLGASADEALAALRAVATT